MPGRRRALLGLGSNVGDRDGNIRAALRLLEERGAVQVLRTSTLRTTAPVGGPPQGDYRNGAALVETTLDARALLLAVKDVERTLGREPGGERWGPRTIDVDLLLLDTSVVDESDLCVPHPRMAERRFVLEPAAEVAPAMRHPVLGRTVLEMWEEVA
jgi:2-amino-4-hydroxy-6-hydroxymethyldihydropteridine diphosphokinase